MQDLHSREFSIKESLAQRASTIIAGMTTLGGIVAFVIVNFKPFDRPTMVAFWLVTIASGIALSAAAFFLGWSYRVPPLNDIGRPTEWLSYWKDLRQQATAGTVASAETEFSDYLLNQYAEIGDKNIDANFKRGTRLVKSNNLLLASFVLVVVTSLTFYYNNYILRGQISEKGAQFMLTNKDAFICLPAAQMLESGVGSTPQPRPVPVPRPSPKPPPVSR